LINNTATESKYNTRVNISSGKGVKGSLDGESCFVETKIRIEITGVGPTSTIDIEGRLRSSTNWYVITTATGAITGTVDISTYDFIRYVVTNSDGTGVLTASGFVLNSAPFKFTNAGELSVNTTGAVSMSGLRVALKITNITITDVATMIPPISLSLRNSILVENRSVQSLFVGNSNVTATGVNQGWEVAGSSMFSTDVTDAISLYGIAPAGKILTIKVMEIA
jgi:hypothetical protein